MDRILQLIVGSVYLLNFYLLVVKTLLKKDVVVAMFVYLVVTVVTAVPLPFQ